MMDNGFKSLARRFKEVGTSAAEDQS
jgi:hypothetical protein